MLNAAQAAIPFSFPLAGHNGGTGTPSAGPSARSATVIGGGAVLVWSTAASFAVLGTSLPPLLFIAGAFAAGFLAFCAARLARGQSLREMLAVPLPVLCLMVLGFLGHNGLYVTALRYAPAAEVNLISYLWPLLMVAFLGLAGVARPTRWQLLGSLLGFAGLAWFVSPQLLSQGGAGAAGDGLVGYLLALCAATCFAVYSALRAKLRDGPPDAAGTACGVAAVIALALHLAFGGDATVEFEPAALLAMLLIGVGPMGLANLMWDHGVRFGDGRVLSVVLIGVGPMGLANLMWDHGVRFGDGRVLSSLAYLTPVLSTLLLAALGLAVLTPHVLIGGGLILGGIALSALAARSST